MAPIYYQPALSNSMQLCTQDIEASDEKRPHQCSQEHQLSGAPCDCATAGSHRSCHKARLRRFLLPVAISLFVVGGLLVLSCVSEMDFMDLLLGGDGVVLGKRQTSSSGQQSSFTSKKLYLIIVFVGLFLVLIAAIMLSAWCCRGYRILINGAKVHSTTRYVARATSARVAAVWLVSSASGVVSAPQVSTKRSSFLLHDHGFELWTSQSYEIYLVTNGHLHTPFIGHILFNYCSLLCSHRI
ncbi:hypothetical protein CONPUDRAFT_147810 [Coniophora puteana RWD-64-598 SS2]|uniref:Uncharacterized protein n=1 Tax=Coniophora puteana (strain RWD-64-598) TaxID=741705 RepID=R7SEA2_CONPW|nr:uncharacterized protein CONPUDRAFT_147810 [Coniophora puteana RWD-64-598 SS2]EIW74180.1 hypothetical protein CONPUDRAFT_147810 [Coniophora puteana RWD-64-598 SS2]